MKATTEIAGVLWFFFLVVVASVHCYGGRGYRDPLADLIMNARRTTTTTTVSENEGPMRDEYYSGVYVGSQEGLKEADKIDDAVGLPGQPQVGFSQYSGYVTVDPKAGRALFYWFTESENPSNHPLVLWLNGGPGCSSIGAGAMTELGPFRVNPDGKTLWYNNYAWNTVANVLFLESPAGVGFSYSNTTSDYNTDDQKTAVDSYAFLINWLERFPEYKTRGFYIAGESYAGHYVPQLAQLILKNNKVTNQTVINLKGIAIGNALIEYSDMMTGIFDFFWSHALLSDESHAAVFKACNFSAPPETHECEDTYNKAAKDWGNVFFYDIYAPLCGSNSTAPSLSSFDPCSDNYVYEYLNTPEVQKALHANVTGAPGPWSVCSGYVFYDQKDIWDSILPVIEELMASGISVWIYSGDTDGRVPVTSTKYSMARLGAPVKTPWYAWDHEGQVGGYAVEYQNVSFVTIRGAGHFVPSYQPGRALKFFSSFLSGKLPPPQA